MDNFLAPFLGGFAGALITAGVNIWLYFKKDCDETKSLIKALRTEIDNLENIFKIEFYSKITEDNEPLWYSYPLNTDYFVIFNANCSKIGKIKNDDLRSTIISIYTMAKFFMDCLRTNNECLREYEKAVKTGYSYGIESAEEALKLSKTDNIIPTVKQIQSLLDKLKTL